MKEIILNALASKRIQGLIALVVLHFFPNLNLDIIGVNLNTIAQGWLGYGILSASTPALPKLSSLFKKK